MPQSKAPPPWQLLRRGRKLVQQDIWHHTMVFDNTVRGKFYALLRVLAITVRGILSKKMFSQAAALSYASLMSLGPIVSLAIMISTFVLDKSSDDMTTSMLNQVVTFIAPTTSNLSVNDPTKGDSAAGGSSNPDAFLFNQATPPAGTGSATTTAEAVNPNPELVAMLNSFVDSTHKRVIGVFGLLILIFICIQMMISIENNFNNIWGVRRGRDMVRRIVLYWTVFSLGVLAAFTTAAVLSAATLGTVAKNYLPEWGRDIIGNFTGVTHLLAFVLLTLLLAVFYRFIPNTKVRWGPALAGGMVVAICLILNNYFSFLYVATVLNKENLYGSVGIIPILMFGLYVFWTMVLFGGVLTYAVQNANNITADHLWNQVSPRTRRMLNLAAFVQIARAFLAEKAGPTAEELANTLRVPAAILNEGLGRLVDLQLVSVVETPNDREELDKRYQPGRPLDHFTLGQFHHALDLVGNADGDEYLKVSDVLLPVYLDALTQFEQGSVLHRTFADLLTGEAPAPRPA